MPEANSYNFTHKAVLELLVRSAGVTEGEWMLAMNFGFTAGNFGPDENSMLPGAVSVVNHVGIAKATVDTPKALKIDASNVKR